MPASPFTETAEHPSAPAKVELDGMAARTSLPTAVGSPPAKAAPAPSTQPLTVNGRKGAPVRETNAQPAAPEPLTTSTGDVLVRGGSRAWIAIGAAIVCVVLAGVVL